MIHLPNGADPELIQTALNNVLVQEYKQNFYLFCKHGLGFKDLVPHVHLDVCQALQDNTVNRKMILLPRDCFKSSIASIAYPIWRLINDPNLRILIDSEVYTNSKNYLRQIREILQTSKITSLFGQFKTNIWNEAEITIAQRDTIKKEASITASGLGTEKTGQHYDIIICDDLNSPKNSKTPENRQKVIDHYKYLQAIVGNGEIVVVATRYAEDDVPGFILTEELGIDQFRIPGLVF